MESTMTSGGDGQPETVEETAPCRKCEQQIPTDVETCPECGFNYGNAIAGGGFAMAVVGVILTVLVVTAIIGIPLIILSPFLIVYGIMTSKPAADVDSD